MIAFDIAALNLGTAVALGALIGTERQLRQRMAGLRTNALVALGAASFVLFAATFEGEVSPTRVAAQIVSGIGFLGAGIIFRDGFSVSGLNTAATLWCSAAVGMMAGHGMLSLAGLITAMVLFVNFGMRPIVKAVKWLARRSGRIPRAYIITLTCRPEQEPALRGLITQTLAGAGVHLVALSSDETDRQGRVAVEAEIGASGDGQAVVEVIVARLSLDPAVLSARWRVADLV